jgi:hypothetical protein
MYDKITNNKADKPETSVTELAHKLDMNVSQDNNDYVKE